MKNKWLYLLLLAGFSICTQYRAGAQISPGVKFGATYSSLFGSDADVQNSRESVAAGFFLNMGAGLLAFQPEVLWVQKGGVNIDEGYNIREDFKINYLEIPFVMKLRLPLGKIYPNAYGGLYYARQLSHTYNVEQLDYGAAFVTQELEFKGDDAGAIGGIGLDIVTDHLFFTIDGRYSRGFSTIIKEGAYDERDIRNGYFMVTAGIGIHF